MINSHILVNIESLFYFVIMENAYSSTKLYLDSFEDIFSQYENVYVCYFGYIENYLTKILINGLVSSK